MKKIKLTKASVLALLLVFTLALMGGVAQADSQSNNYKMTSDVLCATGGNSGSTNYTMKVSVGGQGSPVGPQWSTNFVCGGGWVYTTGSYNPTFICGDANGDGEINVGDVVYQINYLFKGGSAPSPLEAGDANSDGNVDVGDVVYLINYLFKGGPPPCSGKAGGALAQASRLHGTPGHAQISLLLNQGDRATANVPALSKDSPEAKDKVFQISVVGKSDRDVAGVQLEIGFNPGEVTLLDPVLAPLTKGLQLFVGTKDGVQKIGILDLTGEKCIPKGEGPLVMLQARGENLSSIKITKAILVDKNTLPLALELSHDLKPEEAKAPSVQRPDVQESTPQEFSLSQNYPNPFNPETDISYALPTDCQVKLTIYNIAGQKVRTLVDEHQTTGFKTIHWNGKDNEGKELASGVYFCKIQAGAFTESMKMILMK